MTILRLLQLFLVAISISCFWYASRRVYDAEITGRVAVVCAAGMAALIFTTVMPFLWLAASGTRTIAWVTGIECRQGQKHFVRFEFIAGAQKFEGYSSDRSSTKKCDALQLGDTDTVVYIASAPQVVVWGSLRKELSESLFLWFALTILALAISYFGVRKRLRDEHMV